MTSDEKLDALRGILTDLEYEAMDVLECVNMQKAYCKGYAAGLRYAEQLIMMNGLKDGTWNTDES